MKSRFHGGSLDGQERDDVLASTLVHSLRRDGRWLKETYERAPDLRERDATGSIVALGYRFASVEDITDRMNEASDRMRRDSLDRVLHPEKHADPVEVFRNLSDEERLELCGMCCRGCGSLNTSCQCWNDE